MPQPPLFQNTFNLLQQQQQFQQNLANNFNQFQQLAFGALFGGQGGGAQQPYPPVGNQPQYPTVPQPPVQNPPPVQPNPTTVQPPLHNAPTTTVPLAPPRDSNPTTESVDDDLINEIFTRPDENTDQIDIRVDEEADKEKMRRRKKRQVAESEPAAEETTPSDADPDLDNRFGLGGILHATSDLINAGVHALTHSLPSQPVHHQPAPQHHATTGHDSFFFPTEDHNEPNIFLPVRPPSRPKPPIVQQPHNPVVENPVHQGKYNCVFN